MFKKIFAAILSICFVLTAVCTPINISAKETPTIEPRWWPGNPNPEPGSEAWLQNHMYLPAPSDKARSCGLQSLVGTGLSSGIGGWIARGVLTAYSFGVTFGIGFMTSYTVCVFWPD